MLIRDLLTPEFEQEMAVTRTLVSCLPDAQLDWRPHPKSHSLRELVSHLVNIPTWLSFTMDTTELDFEKQTEDWKTPQIRSMAHAIETLDTNVSAGKEKLSMLTNEAFLETWTLRAGSKIFFTIPKIAAIRGYALNHLVHHRGQLSVYLRLLDVPLPQIYGPTADNKM